MSILFNIPKTRLFNLYKKKIERYHIYLHNEEAPVLNWVNNPLESNKVLDRLKATNYKKFKYDTLVIVGSGGSINASKAVLSAIKSKKKIVFISNGYIKLDETLNSLNGATPLFHIMSQSGNTLDTILALKQIYTYLIKHKFKPQEHLFISTSSMSGDLYKFAIANNLPYIITPNCVGRYSALSSHIINMILAGLDYKSYILGAKDAYFDSYKTIDNPCYRYAINRIYQQNIKNKSVEIISTTNDKLDAFQDWYCQLFAESEGKENKGALPIKIIYPEHLHSYEQFFQQGRQIFFETMLSTATEEALSSCVVQAHKKVKISTSTINIDKLDEYTFGYLFYFFHKACAMNCMLLGVDPYTQPGVENYKKLIKSIVK